MIAWQELGENRCTFEFDFEIVPSGVQLERLMSSSGFKQADDDDSELNSSSPRAQIINNL